MSSIAPAAELCGSAALKKLLSVTDERRKESDNNRTASVSDSLDSGKIFRISADRIIPNHAQPRKLFDEDAILRLADSIRRYGLLQPLSVRRLCFRDGERGSYEIVAGERRFRAATLIGMEYIPCIIISADDRTAAELALIENIPVSYTHLDVYKRQVYNSLDGFIATKNVFYYGYGAYKSGENSQSDCSHGDYVLFNTGNSVSAWM